MGDPTLRGVELIFQINHRQLNRPVLAGLPDDVQSDPENAGLALCPCSRQPSETRSISRSHSIGAARPIWMNARRKFGPASWFMNPGCSTATWRPTVVRNVPRLMRWYCQTCCRNCSLGWAPRAGWLVTPVGAIVNRGWARGEYFVPGFWFQALKKNTWPLGLFGASCRSHFA